MAVETITTISPTTGKPVILRQGLTSEQILALGTTAQQAFTSFRSSHPTLESRQEIVKKVLALLLERKDVMARELTEQMGRPISYTPGEINTAVKRGEYMLQVAPSVLLEKIPGDSETGFNRYITRQPVGVVLIIFAWNYPYLILMNSIVAALLAGNAIILKPSPQTPTVAEHFSEVFQEAGLPQGVLQYLHCGSPTDLAPLIQSPLVNHICFTGSVAGGIAVQQLASNRTINVGLELGGKDPAYIRSDVDVAWVAEEIVDGSIFNSGQSCCSIERVYVHESIHDAFVAATQKVLEGYKVGDPMDKTTQIGPVISARSKEFVLKQVADAIAAGAKDMTPEVLKSAPLPSEGNFVTPVLLTNVNHSMSVMMEETFGPVVAIQKVSSDEEAIKLMNDSEFGLTASIWTKDNAKGEELAQQVEAGTVFVNRSDYLSPDLAWTGWKNSGKGVTLSKIGFEQFVKYRNIHVKTYPK